MRTKANRILCFSLLCSTLLFMSCTDTDEIQVEEETIPNCDVSGTIDESLFGTWIGEIYFDSNNTSYSQSHTFKSDGTVVGSGPDIPDLFGCWRITNENIRYIGNIQYNGNSFLTTFQGRLITTDSIYGTYTSDNDESGTIWMTR